MNISHNITSPALLVLVFLLPIFFIPFLGIPLAVSKVMLAIILASILFIAYLIDALKRGSITLPVHHTWWAALLLPIVYYISSLAGSTRSGSLFGYGVEVGTFASILLGILLMLIVSLIVTSVAQGFKVYAALLSSFVLIAIFGLIKVVSLGKIFNAGIFNGVLGNSFGVWTDYSLLFVLFLFLSITALEMLRFAKPFRIILYGVFGVSLLMLVAANFGPAWIIVLLFSILAGAYFIVLEKPSSEKNERIGQRLRKAPPLIIVVFFFSILFIINPSLSARTGRLGEVVSRAIGSQNIDVRPSVAVTLGVTKPVIKAHPLTGSGPNTFSIDWSSFRPLGVNGTNFWSVAFPFGSGFMLTQISSVGILGSLVWIGFFALLIMLSIKVFRKLPASRPERFAVVSSFLGTSILWVMCFVSAPGIALFLLAFIFTGLFIALAAATRVINTKTLMLTGSMQRGFAFAVMSVFLGAGVMAFGVGAMKRELALVHFNKAQALSVRSDSSFDAVQEELQKAIQFVPQDIFFRFLSRLHIGRADAAVTDTSMSNETKRTVFQEGITKSVVAAQEAITLAPNRYENWVALGSIYESLVPDPLNIEEAYNSAKIAYTEAAKRNPQSPDIPLFLARLELSHKNPDAARAYLEASLAQKPDYADAYFLLAQIDVSQNKLQSAIASAEKGALLAPGNPGVLFQIGLLKYSNKDFSGAVDAFGRALLIVPDYANAQYFLGLSLDRLGRRKEALMQFENLERTNPNNPEVKSILENLRAGREAFYKIAPPISTPEKRSKPPISNSSE